MWMNIFLQSSTKLKKYQFIPHWYQVLLTRLIKFNLIKKLKILLNIEGPNGNTRTESKLHNTEPRVG